MRSAGSTRHRKGPAGPRPSLFVSGGPPLWIRPCRHPWPRPSPATWGWSPKSAPGPSGLPGLLMSSHICHLGSPSARVNLHGPWDTPTPLSLYFPICEIGRTAPRSHVCGEGARRSQRLCGGLLSRQAFTGAGEASGSQQGGGTAQALHCRWPLPKCRETACGKWRPKYGTSGGCCLW